MGGQTSCDDVTQELIALYNRSHSHVDHGNDLEAALRGVWNQHCPVCKNKPCYFGVVYGEILQSIDSNDLIDDIDDDELGYYEIQIIIEFTQLIPIEKAAAVQAKYKNHEPRWVDVPGVGKCMAVVNPKFDDAIATLERARELHKQIKSDSGSTSSVLLKEELGQLKRKLGKQRREARIENAEVGGIVPDRKEKLIEQFIEVKNTILLTIRIPISKMKKGLVNIKAALKLIDDWIPLDAKSASVRLKAMQRVGKGPQGSKGALLRMRCPAQGCSNPKLLEWCHIGGSKLRAYDIKEGWMVEHSEGGKVRCRSCKDDHALSGLVFSCELHKEDYRKHR